MASGGGLHDIAYQALLSLDNSFGRILPHIKKFEELASRYRRKGNLDDLQQAIQQTQAAATATPLGHPLRGASLTNLFIALSWRFERLADVDDMRQAIFRAVRLGNLGSRLHTRFERTRDLGDLQQAIFLAEQALTATPLNHPYRSANLENLGYWLTSRFERLGDPDDLQQAILQSKESVALTPLDHPDRARRLNNVGITLYLRFGLSEDQDDLELAMLHTNEAVAVTPLGHPDRAHRLHNLGISLNARYERTGELADLQQAIVRVEEAIDATPLDHPTRVRRLNKLAQTLIWRYQNAGDPKDRERAVCYLKESTAAHYAPPAFRIDAALNLASILEKDMNWVDASKNTETAVNLLPHVSSRSLGHQDQQHMMKRYNGVASRSAALALQAGKSATDAVQLLELGRAVIANLQFETRTDLTELTEQHPLVATKFEQLRNDLEISNNQSLKSAEPTSPGPSRHVISLELDKTVDRIRHLPSFERFLLPPTANELMGAAGYMHPVVLINVHSLRCDALLIQQHRITSLKLPRLHITAIKAMLEWLQWLWNVMAGPILHELGFREAVTTDDWPRICWIPTGPLCMLPIHAAGYHCEMGSRTVLDRVISSYSPSVKALLYARRNEARQNKHTVSDKAVIVSMETTPKCTKLAFARKEIIELESLLPSSIPRVVLHKPKKEEVLASLSGCSIFHFAGHSHSHPSDPSMSTLLMSDWQKNPFTVKDFLTLKYHQNPPLLAYLSACSTGDNRDYKLLDEGIHLMGACQLAGFRHVIGSLWEVSDKHCVDVAREVYSTMIEAGMSRESVSLGLHHAILNLRDGSESMIDDPLIWAAYIHMGI
ncbi:CHAT domain-containing protein [Trichophaea hybrida]|nr:CHAT domain-containing protein [Trichophaea hybrida]